MNWLDVLCAVGIVVALFWGAGYLALLGLGLL